MPQTRYVDFNRGDDNNDGLTKNTAYKTLSKVSGLSFGSAGASRLFLANDSVFEINPTLTASNRIVLDSFAGTATARALITGYDFAGETGTQPIITYRFLPTSNDWIYESATNSWYVQFTHSSIDAESQVKIGNTVVESTFQGGATLKINNFINGVTANTTRCFIDTAARRIYLAYAGLTSTVTPTNFFTGQISFALTSALVSFFNFPHTTITGLTVQNGGRLIQTGNSGVGYIAEGFKLNNCKAIDSTGLISINNNGVGVTGLFEIDIANNTLINSYSHGIRIAGNSITGFVRNNNHTNGNLGDCTGGGIYVQSQSPVGRPLQINDEVMDSMQNGRGTCTYDGCGIYLELGSNDVVINRAKISNTYKPIQFNSGRKSTLLSSLFVNCDMFGSFTDADNVGTSEYLVAHNTFISTPTRLSFRRGTQATSTASLDAFHNGAMTSSRFINNVMIGNNFNTPSMKLYYTPDWNAGKVIASKNYFSGYGPQLITDLDGTPNDRTSQSACLIGGNPSFTADYKIKTDSTLIGVGNTSLGQLTDGVGSLYANQPSVGAYEKNIFVSYTGCIY